MTLFEFTSEKSVTNWYAQNDTVMGGISNSQMVFVEQGIAAFTGHLSLENNGGFAQVKYSKTRFDLQGFEGLELSVKGDGKHYQLRLETDAQRVSYTQHFLSSSEWQVLRLPFTGFKATFRGRDVPSAPALNQAFIKSVNFMLSDQQTGAFELHIDTVSAY